MLTWSTAQADDQAALQRHTDHFTRLKPTQVCLLGLIAALQYCLTLPAVVHGLTVALFDI